VRLLVLFEFVVLVGAAIGVFHRLVVHPITSAIQKQQYESRKMAEVLLDVNDKRRELKANGGTSLRDAVIRIEGGMNEIKGRFDAHLDLHLQEDHHNE
jgi:hypothetical protein